MWAGSDPNVRIFGYFDLLSFLANVSWSRGTIRHSLPVEFLAFFFSDEGNDFFRLPLILEQQCNLCNFSHISGGGEGGTPTPTRGFLKILISETLAKFFQWTEKLI